MDTITAGAGDDTINYTSTAADANDRIDGGTGVDTIAVSAGSAIVFNTDDSIITNVEVITVGSGASVTTTGQTDGFVFTAGSGNETITSGAGNDSVTAGLGNDVILTGAGADTVDGGAGTDTISFADITTTTSHGLTLAAGGAAAITGVAVNLSGAAILDATLAGAVGVGLAATTQAAALGSTGVAAGTAGYLILGGAKDAGYAAIDTLSNIETVIGSSLSDFIALGAGGMTATGGAGIDALIGGSGNDTLNADFTDLAIAGGAGTDTAVFAAGGTMVAAVMTGVENVSLTAAGTYNFAAHTLAASYTTADVAINFTGSATAANTITTGSAADIIAGGGVVDTINSGDGNDNITGAAGNDVINGGAGNDIINGGAGSDTMTGGTGSDRFVLTDFALAAAAAPATPTPAEITAALGADLDVITDFEVGVDSLDIISGAPGAIDLADAIVQTTFAAAVTRSDLVTIESFSISATGVVTLFDEAAAVGTTEVFAETTDDMLLIARALRDEATNSDEVFIFKVDADGNGVAESSFVVSENATNANVQYVQLVGVAAADLSLTQVAGDIHLI